VFKPESKAVKRLNPRGAIPYEKDGSFRRKFEKEPIGGPKILFFFCGGGGEGGRVAGNVFHCTEKSPTVNLLRLNTLRGTKTAC